VKKKILSYWSESFSSQEAKDGIKLVVPKIEPAKKFFPNWLKNIDRFYDGSSKIKILGWSSNIGVKSCSPFTDTFTSGYMISLHCDLLVENYEGDQKISWRHELVPVTTREFNLIKDIPSPNNFSHFEYAWELFYRIKLPKGYSALFTHPLNRLDLPFFTASGIVDADYGMGGGGVSFCIDKGFEGIIPAGTPIVQIFPFKRDDWKSKYLNNPKEIVWNPRENVFGWYKKNVWKKKFYE
jgi:hypothetical protein